MAGLRNANVAASDVELAPLKRAVQELPPRSLVRRLVLAEPPRIPREVFLAKSEEWARVAFVEAEDVRDVERSRRALPRVARALERAVGGSS
jgi:hypothetical protein